MLRDRDSLRRHLPHAPLANDEHRDETLRFLEQLGATNVIVDAPRIEGAKNLVPTVFALTSPTLYVRFHGRNADTWNKRGGSASERFDYLYSRRELEEWVQPLRELAAEAREVSAMFNNNGRSTDVAGAPFAQAPANAAELIELLASAGVQVAAAR